MSRTAEPYSGEYLLLGLIRSKPIHAYDLHKHLIEDEDLHLIWRFNQSQLYALLEKLDRAGYISATIAEGTTFPFRKVYTITDEGADLFENWLEEPVLNQHNLRRDFIMKLYFLLQGSVNEYRRIIQLQLNYCASRLEKQQANLAELSSDEVFQRAVYEFRAQTTLANINWLNGLLKLKES